MATLHPPDCLEERDGLGRLVVGRVKYRYASGFFSPAALLADHFEHLFCA